MEGFIVFLVIIGIFLKIGGAAKKKTEQKPAPAKVMPAEPAPAPGPAAAPSVPAPAAAPAAPPMPDIGWLLEEEEEECVGPAESHTHGEGFSHADDKGCVGGSMSHAAHEGSALSREGRGLSYEGRSMRGGVMGPGNLAARTASEPEKVRSHAERARISAREMRRAVVTSEILREPVALRGRTAGR
ncbi:MAG: hypothetical protein Q4A66_09765 [Eubacteriales bacterium]|nr:hypothetical protein [Eubacteriales bacterium]